MRLHHYDLYDGVIASNVELATLRASRSSVATLRFEVLAPRAPEPLSGRILYEVPRTAPAEGIFFVVARDDDRVVLRFSDIADFVTTADGDNVRCIPLPEAPLAALEQIFVDQVVPRLFYLQGRPVLHASAVKLSERGDVLALLGQAGTGKSTLCAALTREGAISVCDDSLALRVVDTTLKVLPGYPSLRIWPDTAEALFAPTSLPAASPWTTKRRLARAAATEPLILRAAVLLEPSDVVSELVPISAREAFSALAPFVHRIDLGSRVALDAEFQLLTELVSRVPVARLRFRHRFDELPQLLASLQRFVASSASAA